MTWSCGKCGAEVDDELQLCWQCGTGRDGSPAPAHWRSETAPSAPAAGRELSCLRCAGTMAYSGRKQFHDGSYARELLLGDFFIQREVLDLYVCQGCGKAELFAVQPAP